MRARNTEAMWRKVPRALGLAGLVALALPAGAQARWTVVTPDSAQVVTAPSAAAAADTLAGRGFLLARLDSARADTAFVTPGPPAVVRRVTLVGTTLADADHDWQTRPGRRFRSSELAADLGRTAERYALRGFADAQLVPEVEVASGGEAVDVTVRIDEGPEGRVVAVELAGARSPSRAYATRRAGLGGPTPPSALDAVRVRERLEASGLYADVGVPVLARDESGDLVLQVPVVEAPPGAFDVVLGYLPPSGGAGGGVVGSGRVDLRNLFGGGRTATVALERTPGLASAFGVAVSDPFVLGSPLGAGLSFAGTSRDSTLARQRASVDFRYALDPTLDLVASLASESVRPGTFGAELVDGRPRVRRTDDVLVGVGLVFARLDRPRAPRRGVAFDVLAEQGRRGGDALDAAPGARRRLTTRARAYLPTLTRQTLVLGADATVTQQQAGIDGLVDEGDLVRFGGATSFRGYDDAEFLAQSTVRGLAEYRVLFDDVSFAFAFVDGGGFDRPAGPGALAERRALVGYGAGLRLATGLGVATVSYALNPEIGPSQGKIHVGLQVGL
ncbi:BamA/TamA family outer membrane protein [Rubrivirga sp.]|uniref:BamA/TamA family outer membrane protein n=1 Tax=Rubrivirga sp. TaxID=1885344 RepID=UPI003B530376